MRQQRFRLLIWHATRGEMVAQAGHALDDLLQQARGHRRRESELSADLDALVVSARESAFLHPLEIDVPG